MYIEKHGIPQKVSELQEHSTIGFSQPISLNNWPVKLDDEHKIFELKPNLLCDNGPLIRQAALRGMGIVCLADFMTSHDLQNGKLVQVLTLSTVECYQPINVVFYKPYQSSLKLKCFIDFIIESIGE